MTDRVITVRNVPNVPSQNMKVITARNFGKYPVKSMRNIASEAITDLSQIQNITEINKVDGASVVWNQAENRYEIKILPGTSGSDVDGGTF